MKPRFILRALLTLILVTILTEGALDYLQLWTGFSLTSHAPSRSNVAQTPITVSVYSDVADCVRAGLPKDACENLFIAGSARAWQTSSAYVTMGLCEQRYGQRGCAATERTVHDADTREVFTPYLAGVVLAFRKDGAVTKWIAFEPVYRCPLDWASLPICYQSVNGTIFKAYDKDHSVPFRTYDQLFRNADREPVGDRTDSEVGHHLIDAQYQLVQPRSGFLLGLSRAVVPRWPDYLGRTVPVAWIPAGRI